MTESQREELAYPRSSPKHTVRLPKFLINEPMGLGRAVKVATRAVGVRPCRGCEARAQRLDQWLGLSPR